MEFLDLFVQAGLEAFAIVNANAVQVGAFGAACVSAYFIGSWMLDIDRRVKAHDWALDDLTDEQLRIRDKVAQHERMLQHMAAMRAAKAEKAAKVA